MAAGKINLQSNDGKVAGVVFEDGAASNVTVTVPKEGGVLATQSGLDTAMSTINASVPASYHIYNGQLALSNTVITNGFSTTLYTGNGTSQSITTGVDMATQWGNDASETYGGFVWIKGRSGATAHMLFDTIRGAGARLESNSTNNEYTTLNLLSSFNTNGYSVGIDGVVNTSSATYASWNFQTTHRVSGTTNHGKPYTCHYNPYTGFTIVKYEGSGLAGHEIPHHLGRNLGLIIIKGLTTIESWQAHIPNIGSRLYVNSTSGAYTTNIVSTTNDSISLPETGIWMNSSNDSFILYGWANSYFDESNKLIGNYEIGVYQGTGASGNKVTTRGKPAWVMFKRLDSAGVWVLGDIVRGSGMDLYPNLSNAEGNYAGWLVYNQDGFTVNNTATDVNAAGGLYLYMVVYDNDSGSGKSKYPKATDTSTLNLNAHVPFANGIDTTGNKVSIAYKNETITLSNSLTQGKNYVALLNDGSYVATTIKPSYGLINPASGDFFNLDTQKWYSNLNVEIAPRNYLDCVVYADQNGQPEYVEQIEKVQYFDAVKANDYKGKNACTAWVNFDGTTTPPTIRDSYNVSSVVRVATGQYAIYFNNNMDNVNYCNVLGNSVNATYTGGIETVTLSKNINKTQIYHVENAAAVNLGIADLTIFGGKN